MLKNKENTIKNFIDNNLVFKSKDSFSYFTPRQKIVCYFVLKNLYLSKDKEEPLNFGSLLEAVNKDVVEFNVRNNLKDKLYGYGIKKHIVSYVINKVDDLFLNIKEVLTFKLKKSFYKIKITPLGEQLYKELDKVINYKEEKIEVIDAIPRYE